MIGDERLEWELSWRSVTYRVWKEIGWDWVFLSHPADALAIVTATGEWSEDRALKKAGGFRTVADLSAIFAPYGSGLCVDES